MTGNYKVKETQQSTGAPKPPKKMPRKCHTGIGVESFPECPINGTGMYTCQREKDEEIQETGLTDLENQMEQTEFAAGHLIDVKIAIDSFLLKGKTSQ